jgi:hypothetical protein
LEYEANLGTGRAPRNLSEGGSSPPASRKRAGLSRMLLVEMPRNDYRRCRYCDQPASIVGELSHTRLCADCGVIIERENALQIHAGSGPYHEKRRYGIAQAVFGPRVALALKQAGAFDPSGVDAPESVT